MLHFNFYVEEYFVCFGNMSMFTNSLPVFKSLYAFIGAVVLFFLLNIVISPPCLEVLMIDENLNYMHFSLQPEKEQW